MTTIKGYTTIEQSKKLTEILSPESADMGYLWNGTSFCEYPVSNQTIFKRIENIPCWSLAVLLCVLPILERRGYQKDKPRLLYNVAINKWIVDSHVYTTDAYDNPVDACYEMILKLHELKML